MPIGNVYTEQCIIKDVPSDVPGGTVVTLLREKLQANKKISQCNFLESLKDCFQLLKTKQTNPEANDHHISPFSELFAGSFFSPRCFLLAFTTSDIHCF